MKIILLTPFYPPELNSTARVFSELAEDLHDCGHDISVITRAPERYVAARRQQPRGFVYQEQLNGAKVWRRKNLAIPRRFPAVRVLEQVWMALTFLAIGLRMPRHDAVIVYSPPLPLGLAGLWLSRRWRGALILNVQDLYPQTVIDLGLIRSAWAIRSARLLERFLYRRAHAVTVHSDENRVHVVGHGGSPDRVHVIPNWVDLDQIRPGPKNNGWRSAHGLGSAFVVSFAGTMGFAQGLEDVVEAADRLRDVPDLLFVLAGHGVFRPSLEESVKTRGLHNVKFVPPQPPDDYVALLQASDVCLATLHRDLKTPVVPGKIPTIMAAGKPVVCVTHPATGARRVIEEARCGYFVPAGEPEKLAELILNLYANRDLVETMGRNARAYAERHFDRAHCTGQYHDLLLRLRATGGGAV